MTRKTISTLVVLVLGAIGVLTILYAWQLPPFTPRLPMTENAAVRGRVTTLAPQVAGYVVSVEVQDFQPVKRGDVIVRLDDRQATHRLEQAEAALEGARASVAIAEQSINSARALVQSREAGVQSTEAALAASQSAASRSSELRERGVASESAVESSGAALAQAQADVAAARAALETGAQDVKSAEVSIEARRADVAAAEAAVDLARVDLDNTVVHAPEDGRMGQIGARLGQYVTAGTALAQLVAPDVWIVANFKETDLHGVRTGQRATFTVDAMGGREFTGVVESYSPAAGCEFSLLPASNATGNFTKVTRRVPLRIVIDPGQEMSELLLPGLSVVVSIHVPDALRG